MFVCLCVSKSLFEFCMSVCLCVCPDCNVILYVCLSTRMSKFYSILYVCVSVQVFDLMLVFLCV